MRNIKPILTPQEAILSLQRDVSLNNLSVYSVEYFNSQSFSNFLPEVYLNQCSSVVVATSATYANNSWLAIIPYRVDLRSKLSVEKVFDHDPSIFLIENGTPSLSGFVAYRQKFNGHHSKIGDIIYDNFSIEETISDLRNKLKIGSSPLSAAPPNIINAITHMAEIFTNITVLAVTSSSSA